QSGHVRGRDRDRAHDDPVSSRSPYRRRGIEIHIPDHSLAMDHFAFREFRRGRGQAQAATLRKARTETMAKRIPSAHESCIESVPAASLRQGDLVLVEAGDLI